MSSTNSFSIQPEKVRAVVFDLGGVLIEGGPSEVVAFGRRIGLDPEKWEVLRREIFGNDSPWARLERGEIDFEHFIIPDEITLGGAASATPKSCDPR